MLKKVLTLSAASVALSVPAYAGFYLNPEFNQTNVGSDWGGNTIDLHIGYDNAAKIAKKALKNNTTLKTEALKTGLINEKDYNKLINLKKMISPS